jgi:predicted transcriptional regulator
MTVNNRRQGNKWTINELISLQREYELLELTVKEIAEKHQRTETAILYKLESEGLIESWNSARGFVSEDYQNSVNQEDNNDKENNEEDQEVGGDDDDEEYQFVEDVSDDDDISDDESEVEKLTERVWSLETSVSEISSMVKNIYSMLSAKQSSKKRKPLRNASTTSA